MHVFYGSKELVVVKDAKDYVLVRTLTGKILKVNKNKCATKGRKSYKIVK